MKEKTSKQGSKNTSFSCPMILKFWDNNQEGLVAFHSSDILKVVVEIHQWHPLVRVIYTDGGKEHVAIYPSVRWIYMVEQGIPHDETGEWWFDGSNRS